MYLARMEYWWPVGVGDLNHAQYAKVTLSA